MRKKDLQLEMKVTDLSLDDSGDYTCVCGEQMTQATVIVMGEFTWVIHSVDLFQLVPPEMFALH